MSSVSGTPGESRGRARLGTTMSPTPLRIRVVSEAHATTCWPSADAAAQVFLRHAERARHLEVGASLGYYWQHASSHVDRVRLEVCAASAGPVAVLVAEPADLPWSLSRRELEVLTCLACGMTNPQIAGHLHVARSTVSTHVEHILDKLGVSTRSGAVAAATAHGALLGPLPDEADNLGPLSSVLAEGTSGTRPLSERGAPRHPPTRSRPAPIRLGSLYPAPGNDGDARAMHDGALLAIEAINRAGGIHGRDVEHVVAAAASDEPGTIAAAVEELRSFDVNAVTTGPLVVDREREVLAELATLDVPVLHSMVSPGLSALRGTDNPRWRNVFQVCSSEDNYLLGFARTVARTVARTPGEIVSARSRGDRHGVAFVVRRPSLTPTFRRDIQRMASSLPMTPVACLDVQDGPREWAAAARTVADLRPAAVFVMTYTEDDFVAFMRQARHDGLDGLVYTTWTPTIPGLLARHADLLDGVYWATLIGLYDNPVTLRFREDFIRRFGRDPGLGSAAIHYDMVHLLRQAWALSGHPWNTAQVVRALRSEVFRGVAGSYFMGGPHRRGLVYPDDTGDLSMAHAHLVYQVRSGVHHLVEPQTLVAGLSPSSD